MSDGEPVHDVRKEAASMLAFASSHDEKKGGLHIVKETGQGRSCGAATSCR
jgi:hypothetical protein